MAAGELIKGRFQKDKKRARNSQKRWYYGLSGPFPGGFEPPVFRLGALFNRIFSDANECISMPENADYNTVFAYF